MSKQKKAEANADLVAFCRQEHRRVVGLLALYLGDEATAQELAQDAFAKVCEHWHRVQHMGNKQAWLNRVALNLARSWFRRRYAEHRARTRHGPTSDAVDDANPTDAVAVRRAVSGLPPRQRTALVLRYYADLPVAEVAAQMGCAEEPSAHSPTGPSPHSASVPACSTQRRSRHEIRHLDDTEEHDSGGAANP